MSIQYKMKENIIAQFLFFVSFITILVSAGEVKLNECPQADRPTTNTTMLIVERLVIQDCTAQPCTAEKGKAYTIETRARFMYRSTMIKAKLIAVIKPLPAIPMFDIDICEFLEKGSCSNITENSIVQGKKIWLVDSKFPSGQGLLRMIVKDDIGVPMFCGELSVIIAGKDLIPSPIDIITAIGGG